MVKNVRLLLIPIEIKEQNAKSKKSCALRMKLVVEQRRAKIKKHNDEPTNTANKGAK